MTENTRTASAWPDGQRVSTSTGALIERRTSKRSPHVRHRYS
jgi:hypothetical protein